MRTRRDLKTRPFTTAGSIIAAIICALLTIRSGQVEIVNHAVLDELRAIELNSASLQRDVLRVRAGQKNGHIALSNSLASLRQNAAFLGRLLLNSEGRFRNEIEGIRKSITRDEIDVETFTTKNALLCDSIQAFIGSLNRIGEGSSRLQGDRNVAHLATLMMQYALQNDVLLQASINRELLALQDAESDPNLLRLKQQGLIILAVSPQVETALAKLQGSDVNSLSRRLRRDFDLYGVNRGLLSWGSLISGCISLLLFSYTAGLFYTQRQQAHRLAKRLEFEKMTKRFQAYFVQERLSIESLEEATRTATECIKEYFGASRFGLALVNTATLEVETYIGDQIAELVDTQNMGNFFGGGETAFYRMLQAVDAHGAVQGARFFGGALGFRVSDKRALLCAIAFRDHQPRCCQDEPIFLEEAVRLLFQAIDHCRKDLELEMLGRRLDHAERLQSVGALAGGIAHEFNNILVAILGYAEMVLDHTKRRPTVRTYVEEIVKAAERAQLSIEQILAFSRKRERAVRPIDLAEVINDFAALLQVSLPKGTDLDLGEIAENLIIDGNPVEIQQILLNLCRNASEAMNDGGSVSIRARNATIVSKLATSHGVLPEGNYAVLSVADTGRGIPTEVMPKIFEPFFTTRTTSGGTGLGLAAVLANVEAHGGHIDVITRPRKGTRFDVYLPNSSRAGQPVPLQEFFKGDSVPLGSGETIVVFELDDVTRVSYEDRLAALGYEPVGFSDWARLEDWLSSNLRDIDLVLIDERIIGEILLNDIRRILGPVPLLVMTETPERFVLDGSIRSSELVHISMGSKALATAIRSSIDNFARDGNVRSRGVRSTISIRKGDTI
ncbi:ATP-binding protein [Rhizobium ruizarguesonis]